MPSDAKAPAVVIVPGLRDHVAEHWQTILEQNLPNAVSVPRMQHDKLSREAWVAALDRTLEKVGGPVILVAHSAGVMITAHWAQRHKRPIRGALLATPPDLETPMPAPYPTLDALRQNGWFPVPRAPLPFRSIVAASTNDPLARYERVAELAAAWGSKLVDLGGVGHLNPAAGYGCWTRAEEFIEELAA